MSCEIVGLSCEVVGLSCEIVGLSCEIVGLSCEVLDLPKRVFVCSTLYCVFFNRSITYFGIRTRSLFNSLRLVG